MKELRLYFVVLTLLLCINCSAQEDIGNKTPHYKNIIRYDLSGAVLFGAGSYIVFGYERIVGRNQGFSINMGRSSLPKLISSTTDNFRVDKDEKRSGFNLSVDYRFYLAKENRYAPPHGIYAGPYYSYNKFTNDRQWIYKNNTGTVGSHSDLTVNTVGVELGCQFIVFKRLALDLVMLGPGVGFYYYKATLNANVNPATQKELFAGLRQLLTQKFPGMNHVFSDKEFETNGTMSTNGIGYRFVAHIGYNF